MSRSALAAVFFLLLALASAPLLTVTHPPLLDYPNHYARLFIMLNQQDPVLSEFYRIVWQPVPNLAMDVIVPLLAQMMPLALAGKMFLVLTFALIASGCLHLNYALYKKLSPLPLLAFLFLYNAALMQGFLNFLVGCGLLLHALAIWIRLAPRPRAQLLFAFTAAPLLYFTHLYSIALFGFFLFVQENLLHRPGFWRRNLRLALPFIPPLLVFLVLSPTSGAALGAIEFTSPLIKIAALGSLVFFSYGLPLNLILLLFLINVLPPLTPVENRRKLFLYMGVALLLYLLLPKMLFSSANADWRLLIPFALVVLSHGTVTLSRKIQGAFLAALCALLVAQIAAVHKPWQAGEALYRDLTHTLLAVPEGNAVYPAQISPYATPHPDYARGDTPLHTEHLFAYAVPQRRAFVPSLFAAAAQQPLRFNPPYDEIAGKQDNAIFRTWHYTPATVNWQDASAYYQYVLVMEQEGVSSAPAPFEPVREAGLFTLYRNPLAPAQPPAQ